MKKQSILTILGVIFSIIIAFLGWILTNTLLERQDIALFNSKGSIDLPVRSDGIGADSDQKINAGIASIITGKKLDKESMIEIAKILNNWNDSRSYARPHEPLEEQLNMEQALAMAEAGLSYFSAHEIISEELLQDEFTQINASLCVNQPSTRLDMELPPEYSYWSIELSNEKINARLRMNAVTGVIWEIGIYPAKEEIQLTSLGAIEILDIYTEYLGLEGEDSVRYNEEFATKGFLGNFLQATAITSGDATYRDIGSITLSISASGRLP